jgi:hypothetical protein
MTGRDFIKELFTIFSNDTALIMSSGAAGGIVRWITLKEKLIVGISSIIVGALCAVYLSPLALPVVELFLGKILVDPSKQLTFSGFIVGLGGSQTPGLIIDVWKGASERLFSTKD